MVSAGSTVLCRQTGHVAWVAVRLRDDGMWELRTKEIDRFGQSRFIGRTAGAGDLHEVTPAPTFAYGDVIWHDRAAHKVRADLGYAVELIVTETRFVTAGGEYLTIASGNIMTIRKADIVLESMK